MIECVRAWRVANFCGTPLGIIEPLPRVVSGVIELRVVSCSTRVETLGYGEDGGAGRGAPEAGTCMPPKFEE